MKIVVSVHVANRLLPQHNIRAANKYRTSSLTVAKESGKDGKSYILLQNVQNKAGTKYLISDIDDILTRFLKQGSMTIRFIAPPHDLYIKGDVLLLQNLLKLVKLAQQHSPAAIPMLSSCTPFSTKMVKKPVTKLVITQKQDYPVLEGFPRTLEILKVCGIGRCNFDERILLLRMLKVLDLSDNKLSALPSLGSLSSLHTLMLGKNNLGSDARDWSCLCGDSLRKNLLELDLSSNSLHVLPEEIYYLTSLVTLKVSNNHLTRLSFGIARLSQLRFLDVSHNNLQSLPCTAWKMKLLEINVSENTFLKKVPETRKYDYSICSLFHLSASKVLEYRLSYSDASIPSSLVRFLNSAGYCWCGRAVFNSYLRCFPRLPLSHIPTVHGESHVPLEMYACSGKCYSSFVGGRSLIY